MKGDDELGADGNNINASSTKLPDYNPDDSSEGKWNMPTGLNNAGNSWYDIIRGKPKFPIQIEKADGFVETISAADKGTAFVEIEKDGKYFLDTNIYEVLGDFEADMITTDSLGKEFEPQQCYENPDGTPITFNIDYLGNHRELNIIPGPFASKEAAKEVLY